MIYSRADAGMVAPDSSSQRAGTGDFTLLEPLALDDTQKNRVKSWISIFFINSTLFIVDLLFPGLLILTFVELPYFVFKIGALTTLIITLSYFCSLQARRIYQARRRRYLPPTQLTYAVHEHTSVWKNEHYYNDKQYLSLLKQDTATYLRALKVKTLRKGPQ